MANLPWPSDISYGRIIGQFAYMDGDSDDKDTTPDMVPAMGTVTITPSVNQVKYNGVEGPKILVPRKILGKLDANGYLVGPDGKQGIVVPSTSNSVLNPSGWTYAVSINITDGGTINLDISLEPGEEKDITTSISIPASGGTVRIIDESTALRAEAAASSIFNIVSEIRDDIEAGKTKGDPGKDAANPNISAQANTTAPGSNAAAAVSGSYPDLTFAFDIPRGDPGKDAANPVITPAVTKIAPGGNPTFNITGTYPNQTYTFGLVTGGKGALTSPQRWIPPSRPRSPRLRSAASSSPLTVLRVPGGGRRLPLGGLFCLGIQAGVTCDPRPSSRQHTRQPTSEDRARAPSLSDAPLSPSLSAPTGTRTMRQRAQSSTSCPTDGGRKS